MGKLDNLYLHSMVHPDVAAAYIEGKNVPKAILQDEVPEASVVENFDPKPAPTPTTKYKVILNVSPDNSGTVTGAGEYDENTKVNITATPKTGYEFVKWSDDDTNASREITVTADVTLTATFEASTPVTKHTITIDDSIANGSVSADKAEAAYGEDVTLTATPAKGYELSAYDVKDAANNPVSVTDNVFMMPSSNVTVSATFEESAPGTPDPEDNGGGK